MAAAPPVNARPSAVRILLADAGLSLLGAGVVYPLLYVGLGFFVTAEGGVAEPSRAGAMAAASVLALTFAAPLWLTGPQSLIGRMMVFALLIGAVFGSHLLEAMLHKTVPADKALPLTAIAAGYVLILFSVGWLMRCVGVGRAGQFGLAALTGAMMIGTVPFVLPVIKHIERPAARKTAVAWFARANPIIASFETVEFKAWMRSNTGGFADYNTGEAFAEDLGGPEAEKPKSFIFEEDDAKKSGAPPIWMKSAPVLTVAGAAVWSVAAFIGWIRRRRAMSAAAAG